MQLYSEEKVRIKDGDEHHSLLQKDRYFGNLLYKACNNTELQNHPQIVIVQTCPDIYGHKNSSLQSQQYLIPQLK